MTITLKTIMAEIRESRNRMSRECNHDPREYVRQLQAFNRKYSAQVRRYRRRRRRAPVESR